MSIYAQEDIYLDFSGDIAIGSNGDVKLATSLESQKSVVNFLLRTDKGEYVADTRIGCDLGSFIGEPLDREHFVSIEDKIKKNLTEFAVAISDLKVAAVPISKTEIGIFVGLAGSYIDQEGNIIESQPQLLSYRFPYLEGGPIPLTG